MRFSTFAPIAAGFFGAADATFFGGIDIDLGGGINLGGGLSIGIGAGVSAGTCDLTSSWENQLLFSGAIGGGIDASLDLSFLEAQCSGGISLSPLDGFQSNPCLRLELGGFSGYFEIDLSTSGALSHSVELIASPAVEIGLGSLLSGHLGAAFALDLLVSTGAAIDCSAGFYVSFEDGDFIDFSLSSKEIIQTKLEGMVVNAIPIAVGAGVDLSAGINVEFGLRLRSQVELGADLDLDIDLGGNGALCPIWIDLCHYSLTIGQSDSCACSVDHQFGINLGLGFDLDVSIGNILDISLSPQLNFHLGGTDNSNTCMPDRGELPDQPTNTAPTVTTTKPVQTVTSVTTVSPCQPSTSTYSTPSSVPATPTATATAPCNVCNNKAQIPDATQDAASQASESSKPEVTGGAASFRAGIALALPIIVAAII